MGNLQSGSKLCKASQVIKHLTARKLQSLRTDLDAADAWDASLPGFGVRVRRSGKKSFWIMYRNSARQKKRYTLKPNEAKTLAEARDTARRLLLDVTDGKDPGQARADYRIADTVAELCADYLKYYAEPEKKASSVQKDRYMINKDILPAIGGMKCCDVHRKHIIRILDTIQHKRKKPIQMRRTRALLHRIFAFGVERAVIEFNPCHGLPKLKRELSRDRVLSLQEIEALFEAIKAESDRVLSNLLLLILLTGQRPGECAGMRWDEIAGNEWMIPKERSKNGRAHRVLLHPWALEILEDQKHINQEKRALSRKDSKLLNYFDEYVFNSRYKGGFTWPYKSIRELVKRIGAPDWRAHDLRRTFSTHAENHGISGDCIDRIQNHVKGGVTGVYQRGDRWAETSAAWTWWGNLLRRIWDGNKAGAKVLPMKGRA